MTIPSSSVSVTVATPIRRYRFLLLSLAVMTISLIRLDDIVMTKISSRKETGRDVTDNKGQSSHQNKEDNMNRTVTSHPYSTTTVQDGGWGPTDPSVNVGSVSPSSAPTDDDDGYVKATNLSRTGTIIVQLSGEMANNLQHIAHGIGLQEWARQEYGIGMGLVIRHFESGDNNYNQQQNKKRRNTNNSKWKIAHDDIQRCFPSTVGTWDWSLGNTNEFVRLAALQKRWLGTDRYDYVTGLVNSYNASNIGRGMDVFANDIITDPNRPFVETDSPIQLPYLLSLTLDVYPMVDRYLDEIRQHFVFDNTACCGLIPNPTDTVFHFRNYMSEMPDWRAYAMGFSELSPQKVVHELFALPTIGKRGSMETSNTNHTTFTSMSNMTTMGGGLSQGDHVTVLSRIPNKYARAYAEAFQNNDVDDDTGVVVTSNMISNQTGVQDFCYIKETTRQLVGNARSTFVFWAAILSTTVQTVRLYHVDTFGLRERHPNYWDRFTYQWTNPTLRNKIYFELYQSEEVDEKEGPRPPLRLGGGI